MKSRIIMAALMLAAVMCTTANASQILITVSGTTVTATYNGTSYAVTATAVDCTSATSGCTTGSLINSGHGLGISGNTASEIADDDYIVLDFSSALITAVGANKPTVTLGLYETNYGNSTANVIGTNTNPIGSPDQTVTQIGTAAGASTSISLNNSYTGALGDFSLTDSSGGVYSYYVVDLTGAGCGVVITSGTAAPEPGTFVMGGMALLGLGVFMRKRNRKA